MRKITDLSLYCEGVDDYAAKMTQVSSGDIQKIARVTHEGKTFGWSGNRKRNNVWVFL